MAPLRPPLAPRKAGLVGRRRAGFAPRGVLRGENASLREPTPGQVPKSPRKPGSRPYRPGGDEISFPPPRGLSASAFLHHTTMSAPRLKIFSGNSNRPLAEEICKHVGVPLGEATVTSFPDGESFVKINENVRGHDIYLVQSTCTPTNHHLMELLIMIDAAKRASAQRITAVIPFYGYARQDRKDQPRVPITAKLVADLLTSAGAHRVLTMDLHSQQIQGFFNIPVDHLFASPVIFKYLERFKAENLVVCSPDVGGMKMAAAYAGALGTGLGMVWKKRTSATTVESVNIVGDVVGKDVLIVDDITETAGTLVNAAKLLRANGAKSVRAAVSHALLSPMAYERLRAGDIDELITTNSIPLETRGLPITVLSVAPLLAEAIVRINNNESVTSLFKVKGF